MLFLFSGVILFTSILIMSCGQPECNPRWTTVVCSSINQDGKKCLNLTENSCGLCNKHHTCQK